MPSLHLDTLRQRYLAGRLVLFAGAGVAQAGGLPSWPALIRRVLEYAQADSPAPETVKILDRSADLLAQGDLILALSELQRAMTATGYGQAVSRALDDGPHIVPSLAQAIAALAPTLQGVVTTNLDRFLERAFAGAWSVYTLPHLDLGQHEHTILKLHGCRTDHNSWVLTRREYDALMHRRPELRDHIRGLYRFTTLLFVGYGLRDPDLDDLLAEFRALAAGAPPQHFALMPRGQVGEASRRHLFAEAGLTILEYDPADGHRELLTILADLAAAQPGALPSVVYTPPQPAPGPLDPTAETGRVPPGNHFSPLVPRAVMPSRRPEPSTPPRDLIEAFAEHYPDIGDARALWIRAGGRASDVENILRPRDLWQHLWLRSIHGASVGPATLLQTAIDESPHNPIFRHHLAAWTEQDP